MAKMENQAQFFVGWGTVDPPRFICLSFRSTNLTTFNSTHITTGQYDLG